MTDSKIDMTINWNEQAANILKIELVKKNMTYGQLAQHLQSIGFNETQETIKQKIFRGSFQFAFFLQCAVALDLKNLKLDELVEKVTNKT